jgi:hypothetical protein
MRRAAVVLSLSVAAASGASAPLAAQPGDLVFPLRLHVARSDETAHQAAEGEERAAPAVTDDWLAAQIETANALFAPHRVRFVENERLVLPPTNARLETRADRHALGGLLDRRQIDVFVVLSLRDVDDPTLMRRGVHWRPAGRPGTHFVIVSAISGESVLAHELGHYFGNPHSSTPGNIMSYERGEVPPFFDAAQGRRILAHARRFARSGAPAANPAGHGADP